jgi:hypothetical protein
VATLDISVLRRSVQAPVFRELYSEKRVVAEERRLRVDDSPMGSFQVTSCVEGLGFGFGRSLLTPSSTGWHCTRYGGWAPVHLETTEHQAKMRISTTALTAG